MCGHGGCLAQRYTHRSESGDAHGGMQGPQMMQELLEDMPAARNLPQGSIHIISGIVAGLAGSTLSHPFDTIKVRMQAFVDKEHPNHNRYNSLVKAAASIAREDGYSAFFHGLAPRAFRIICAPTPPPHPPPALPLTSAAPRRSTGPAPAVLASAFRKACPAPAGA